MIAPKRFAVVQVNGQFYEGGQFTPDHGLYCGKGRNRVTAATLADYAGKAEAKGLTLRVRADGLFQLVMATGNGLYSAANLKTLAPFLE